ncbi:hypothetical protein HDV06_000095 [Boothiomyces sp. JEL0866]|nr:hypothetical protein HDV06_000095 [Boothiomyces sp. JEL0866]
MGSGNSTARESVHSNSHRPAHSPSHPNTAAIKPRTTHPVNQSEFPRKTQAKSYQPNQQYSKHHSGSHSQSNTSGHSRIPSSSSAKSVTLEDAELNFLMETGPQPAKRRRSTTPKLAMIQEDKKNKDEAFNRNETVAGRRGTNPKHPRSYSPTAESPLKFDMERFQKANVNNNMSGSMSGSNGGLYRSTDLTTVQSSSPAKYTLLDDADESLMDQILAGI